MRPREPVAAKAAGVNAILPRTAVDGGTTGSGRPGRCLIQGASQGGGTSQRNKPLGRTC